MSDILKGARVMVVGASSGIGLATSKAFAHAGATVVMASRGGDKLDRAVAEVGQAATALIMNTGDAAAVEAAFAGAPFDHVVVSASQTVTGSIRQLSLEDARKAMESKFWGAYRVARAARISPSGSLTLVSGVLAIRPSKTAVLQGAINAAIEGLVRGLALELAPVRINVVSPGTIDTPIYAQMSASERDSVMKSAAARLPVGRVGQAEDIANAILFLALNPFASGSTIRVDGGGAIA